MDYYWAHVNSTTMPLRYSDFNIGKNLRTNKDAIIEKRDWLGTDKELLNKTIAKDCDGILQDYTNIKFVTNHSFQTKLNLFPSLLLPKERKHK